MKILQYFFYKFYRFSKLLGSGNNVSYANAFMNLSVFLGLNILSVLSMIELYYDKIIFNGAIGIGLTFSPLILVYSLCVYKKEYLKFNDLFYSKNNIKNMLGTILTIIYCLSSILIFIQFSHLVKVHILKVDS